MSHEQPLISVVIPAWNAEETLGATLASAVAQTYSNIEILIVDDGSTDSTGRIACELCAQYPRARLIRQDNAGLAAARNAAIAVAQGEFIAPLDADDLWHPGKLERQLACFQRGPAEVGLVYCWSRIIDEHGDVLAPSTRAMIQGDVLEQHLGWNFIGNGSTPLIRTEIFRDLHYSSALRQAGCQGCEDFLLQLQIASRFQFGCVPAFLTGYRVRSGAMSGDVQAMIRSHMLMYRILQDSLAPAYHPQIEKELGRQFAALGLAQLRRGRILDALGSQLKAISHSPRGAALETWFRLYHRALDKKLRTRLLGKGFAELSPEEY